MEDLGALDHAIDELEAKRALLGDDVVDVAVAPLREKRAAVLARTAGEQRKLVTVVFADLVDFTVLSHAMDPEDVRTIVNSYFTRWQASIVSRGGVVEKFIGDAVMAVFGLALANEDDPHRAIRAALAMRADLDELNARLHDLYGVTLQMRVGIDTGEVVVSLLDDRPGTDFVVVGDTVNRAARLQAVAAPGSVLISADTYRHVRGWFGFEPRPGLTLKGLDEPVDGYVVLTERPAAFGLDRTRGVEGVDTDMVGRDLELRYLQDRFAEVADDGRPRVVTVVGDPGVGKSRLLVEFDKWLAEMPDPAWWFKGRASSSTAHSPNALLRDLMATRLEIHDSEDTDTVRGKWERAMEKAVGPGEAARAKAHAAAHWLGFDIGDPALLGLGTDPQALRDRGRAVLGEYLQRLAEDAPVVVLLEDLHWADDSSLECIDAAHAVLHDNSVLVVATTRPTLFEQHPHWGEGLDYHSRLELRPLSNRDSRRLLAEILQLADDVPPALTDLVVTAAEGNPYYLEELVKFLLEAGAITSAGGVWHVHEDRLREARVPPTLKGVLQARLDALSVEQRAVLQRASVVGRIFWDEAVASLATAEGRDAAAAPTAATLDELRSREVVFEHARSAFERTREFLFRHAMLRDVTYEGVLRTRRREYHGLAARWFEEMAARSGRRDEYAALIAAHHDEAGSPVEAGRWYLRAGRQASGVHAQEEALRMFGRGLVLAPDTEPALRADLLLGRVNVFHRQGDRAAQAADLDAADALLADADEPGRWLELQLARCKWLFHGGAYEQEVALADTTATRAEEAGFPELALEARLWQGKALTWDHHHAAADEVLSTALGVARAIGASRLVGELLRALSVLANNQSDFDRATSGLEEAREVLRAAGDVDGENAVLVQLGSVLYNQGRYEEARACLEESLPIFAASGYRYGTAVATGNLGCIVSLQGEFALALRLSEEARELGRGLGDLEAEGSTLSVIGDILRRVGDVERATERSREALAVSQQIGWRDLESDSYLNLAVLATDGGDHTAALELAGRAVGAADAGLSRARATFGEGRALLLADRPADAVPPLRQAAADAEALAVAPLVAESRAALAWALAQTGEPAEAVGLVEQVLDQLDLAVLGGAIAPGDVYLACWRALSMAGDPRAAAVLEAADGFLADVADRIDAPDLRAGFLGKVPAHVELRRLLESTSG